MGAPADIAIATELGGEMGARVGAVDWAQHPLDGTMVTLRMRTDRACA